MIAAAIFIALLVGAFLAEGWRRRRDRKLRLEAEWRAVDELMREREFTQDEKSLLRTFIQKYASLHPLKAVTIRQHFDDCVEADLSKYPSHAPEKEQRGVLLRDIRSRLGLDHVPIGQRIETTRELFPGQPIWISPAGGEKGKTWQAMGVTEVDEAKYAVGPKEGTLAGYSVGGEIECRMWREEDARYIFTCEILRVEKHPLQIVLAHSDQLQRTQSRAHYRIRHEEAVEVEIISAPPGGDETNAESRPVVARMRGRVTSLSGGGLAIVVGQPVPTVVFIRAQLNLETHSEPLSVMVRLVESSALTGGRYLLRGAFIGMGDETRDLITHFVFKQQQHQAASAPAVA